MATTFGGFGFEDFEKNGFGFGFGVPRTKYGCWRSVARRQEENKESFG